jgi:hypothetical protein
METVKLILYLLILAMTIVGPILMCLAWVFRRHLFPSFFASSSPPNDNNNYTSYANNDERGESSEQSHRWSEERRRECREEWALERKLAQEHAERERL